MSVMSDSTRVAVAFLRDSLSSRTDTAPIVRRVLLAPLPRRSLHLGGKPRISHIEVAGSVILRCSQVLFLNERSECNWRNCGVTSLTARPGIDRVDVVADLTT